MILVTGNEGRHSLVLVMEAAECKSVVCIAACEGVGSYQHSP